MRVLSTYLPGLQVFGVTAVLWAVLTALGYQAAERWGGPAWDPEMKAVLETAASVRTLEQQGPPFALIVGNSSARDAFDHEALETSTGLRWSNVANQGAGYQRLTIELQPLLDSELTARVAVLAIHPLNLRRQNSAEPIVRLRQHLFTLLHGLRKSLLVEPLSRNIQVDPFRRPPQHTGPTREHSMEEQFQALRESGAFRPENYRSSNQEVRALRLLLQAVEARTDRLVVLLMPEQEGLRNELPPEAKALAHELLQGYELYDWSDSVPKSGFVDYLHLNEEGRAVFTPLLVELLTRPQEPPADSPPNS